MTERKSPLDPLVDLLVYAPVGAALVARERLPQLIDKGRGRLAGQVATAKLFGRLAVSQGRSEADRLAKQAGTLLAGMATRPPIHDGPAPSPPATPVPVRRERAVARPQGRPEASPGPSEDSLAIPGYDSLSASQVVQRLDGLAPGELEAVRIYEATTRRRRTILSRIAQLQPGPAAE